MDTILLQLIGDNWISMLLFVVVLVPIIPPNWLGLLSEYKDKNGMARKYLKMNIAGTFIFLAFKVIDGSITQLMSLFTFDSFITLVVFVVIGVDLFFRREISQGTMVLTGIGIVIKYLQQIIDQAKRIKLWRIEWESK